MIALSKRPATFIEPCLRDVKPRNHVIATPSSTSRRRLFGRRGVLGDGLGALRHGVLGKLTGKDEADGGLDLTGRDGGLLVVGSELGGLGGDALEDVWGRATSVRLGGVQDASRKTRRGRAGAAYR